VVSFAFAGEPVQGECSAVGSEGMYYLVDPLPDLEPSTTFELTEHPTGSNELMGQVIMPPLPGEASSEIHQLIFEQVSLHDCRLRFAVQFPDGTTLEFDGKFVMANPLLVEDLPNPVALAGRFTITTSDQKSASYERALFFDSGH
jgi:hypothetical protein